MNYLSKVPEEIEEEFNDSLLTKNKDVIGQAMYDIFNYRKQLAQRMRARNIIFIVVALIINTFCWYYMLVFCAVYMASSLNWLYSCITGLIISWFIIGILMPLVKALLRLFNRKHKDLKFFKYLEYLL